MNEPPPTNVAPSTPEPESAPGAMCPACNSSRYAVLFPVTDRKFFTTTRVFEIVECVDCRLIRLHPWPDPSELASFYPPGYWEAPEITLTDRLEQRYREMVQYDHARFVERALAECDEPGVILDVACGAGLFLRTLRSMSTRPRRVAGIDFSLDAALAAARNGVPAVCASLTSAPFRPGSCAVITMFNVLGHLYNPAHYMDAAHRLLAPGGRLIVQIPNAASWQFLLLGERWSGLDVPRRLIHFTLPHLEALLADCGFEVLRHKHFSLRDGPAGLATSLMPGLDPTIRRLRRVSESPGLRLLKDALYFGLVALSMAPALLESASGSGTGVTVVARKKS